MVAVVALMVQQWLEPFTAGSHMGLLTNGGDLEVYRQGAQQLAHGDPLYVELPVGWFTYPPFAAMIFTPLAYLPGVKAIWMLISFGALTATVWRCATVLGYRKDWSLALLSLAAALALDIEAVRGTLWQGQVNIVLMAIIVGDLTRPAGARWRGWSVGVAAGIKLTAIVFVPYLVITRQWRAAATASGAAAATVVLAWCVSPPDSTEYWSHAVFQIDRIGTLTHPGNFSISGILATIWAPSAMPTIGWLIGVVIAAVSGYYAAYCAHRRGRGLVALSIVGLMSCVVPPLAWGHHWVWTVPLLAVVIDRAVRSTGGARWAWAGAAGTIYLSVFMWFSAWLYRTASSLGSGYPTYVEALDAAINQLTRFDKLVAVAHQPVLFFVVAVVTIMVSKMPRHPRV